MWHDRFYHSFIYNTIGCILTHLSVDSLRSSVSESIFLTLRITVVLFWRLTFLECLLWVCFFKFQEFLKISEHSLQRAWLGPFFLFFFSKVPKLTPHLTLSTGCWTSPVGEKENKGKDQTKQKTWGDSNVVLVSFSVYLLVSCKIPLLQERFSTVRKRSVLGFVGIFLFIVHRQNVPIQVLFLSGFIVTLFTL